MKQVLQQARTGEVAVVDVPVPKALPGCVLVRIAASLVSAGTERASTEFASKNLLQKAKARPDLVREVLTKLRRDGLSSTAAAVRGRLDEPNALGYSSAGTIVEIGDGVTDLCVGDHVACAGAGYAVHAEVACVPRLLIAKVPLDSSVTPEEAAFATLGAVAMHGIRTAEARLGDTVAVIGLGLLGQLTVQLLKAAGCRVIGLDLIAGRTELARQMGADAVCVSKEEFRDLCFRHSQYGADAVLITAETPSSDPVNLAGQVARERGIVVAIGTVGMEIDRKIYYAKELEFRISRSYGPGRYDAAYEQKGRDYPIGYVRWTETRNMEAFVQLLADGKVDVRPLITHRFPIDDAFDAYDLITGRRGEPHLGVLITYPSPGSCDSALQLVNKRDLGKRHEERPSVGMLGAGNFARTTLLPALKKIEGIELAGLCAATGVHANQTATKFGFQYCTTDEDNILNDRSVNTVVIATRHHLHGSQVLRALTAGKHIFCEKPLCLTQPELSEIAELYGGLQQRPLLMVGFNRRFAPMAIRMKAVLDEIQEPLAMHYRVNAGSLPKDHWADDPEQGGGRLLGEVCHFIDFLGFLAGETPIEVVSRPGAGESVTVSLKFGNGSNGMISYLTTGDRSYSKERVEVFAGGAIAILEDFRKLELVRHGRKQVIRARFRQDKGHRGELAAFFSAIGNGGEAPIRFETIVGTTLATLRAAESRRWGKSMDINLAAFMTPYSHV